VYVILYILIAIIALAALILTIAVGREQNKPPIHKSQLNKYLKEYIERSNTYEKETKKNMLKISIYYIIMAIICVCLLIIIPFMV
jgi:Na+-transporting NADH:ubiquinone oxidoreductase subunit NqrA